MPGPKTVEFLTPNNYETFYKLVHELSERALLALTGISTRAQVLKKLHEMTAISTFADQEAAHAAENVAFHLCEFAQMSVQETRQFFWPRPASDEDFHQVNQARWSPYDAQAWDAFFAEFVSFMEPRLQTLAMFIHRLKTAEELSGVAVRPDGSENFWVIGEHIPHESYQRLAALLNEAGFEAAVFQVKQ
jgi:hypothetical protein